MTAVVGEMLAARGLDIVGLGVAESRGSRRGVVVNLEAAVDSIKKAIEEAELMAGVEIDSVHLALSGPHIKGFNSRGVIAVAGKNREITREDVRRAIDAAKAVSLPTGREILHVLPQDFVVDDQDGIGAPVGMTGARLEVNVHIITGSQTSTQNIVACVNRAGVSVAETVVEQLAASGGKLSSHLGRGPARGSRKEPPFGDYVDRRRIDPRRHARNRGTDLRSADSQRVSQRRRRSCGSRQQPNLRDRCGTRVVRVP